METAKRFILFAASLLMVSCQKPGEVYEAIIMEQGFIPYRAPIASAGVGTLIKGNANQFLMFARADECFPQNLDLSWFDAVDLPDSYKEFSVDFNADLSTLTQNGNPTIELKSTFKKVKTVDIKFGDGEIQTLNQVRFKKYYDSVISEDCKKYVTEIPFIVQALRVDKMSFTFKNESGGSIKLSSDNIDEIVKIHAGIEWSIKNNMTLEITSPKFIGYKMAKLRPQDEGLVRLMANRIDKDGKFLYDKLRSWKQLFW